MKHIVFLLYITCSVLPAGAADVVDEVRAALDASKFEELEQILQKAHVAALEEKDFGSLRKVYATLFVTAHRERFAKTKDWLTAFPESPYAATALAWSHYTRASLFRGEHRVAYAPIEAREAFRDELSKAKSLLEVAIFRADDFLPALDASILLKMTGVDRGAIQPVVDRSLGVAPNIQTVNLALDAARLNWGGSIGEILAICAVMAPRVPDYDETSCLISAALGNDASGVIRKTALALLDQRDDPALEYARFSAYVREWRNREGAEAKAIAFHRSTLGPLTDINVYIDRRESIRSAFRNELYDLEAKDALAAMVEERLPDNPQNYKLLRVLIEDIRANGRSGDRAKDAALARQYWQEMLELGRFNSQTWSLGEKLAYSQFGSTNLEKRWPYMANQIYYSNYSPFSLNNVLFELHQIYLQATTPRLRPYVPKGAPPVDLEAVQDKVMCPMIRVARLLEYICEQNSNDQGCSTRRAGGRPRDKVLRLAKTAPQCDWIAQSKIEDLAIVAVPVQRFFEEF